MSYRIRTVSEMTGIPRNTLIAWERRYGFVSPRRHENGYRSYSDEDVDLLLRVKNALRAGLRISEAIDLCKRGVSIPDTLLSSAAPDAALSDAALSDAAVSNAAIPNPALSNAASAASAGAESPTAFRPSAASYDETRRSTGTTSAERAHFESLRDDLVNALIHYRGREAELLLGRLVSLSFEQRVHNVYFPVLQRIGDLWERGEVNVAQEHYASAIVRDQLVGILVGMGTRTSRDPHAACATFPGEQHEMGALALAVHLGLSGYRVSYLGANLPLDDLIDFCRKQEPVLVCISAIRSTSRPLLLDYARNLRAGVPASSRLVLGGTGVAQTPPLVVDGVEFIPNWHDFRP